MSEFSISSGDFKEGEEIPKKCGYKHGNEKPKLIFEGIPGNSKSFALIMDDPDAMGAVGKVWVHWLYYTHQQKASKIFGKTDFGETKYGGPAPPDGRHTYVFKGYALDIILDLDEGYSKQELEDAMKGHIITEAKLTGTYEP